MLAAADLDVVTGPGARHPADRGRPALDGLERLVGRRAGGNLRKAIAEELPHEVEAGTPLHLLLDDLAGATLISGFAYFVWADLIPGFHERMAVSPPVMEGICSGFQPRIERAEPRRHAQGHEHEHRPPRSARRSCRSVGWHELGEHPEIAMRRARRIDVWVEDGEIRIDAHVPRQLLESRG